MRIVKDEIIASTRTGELIIFDKREEYLNHSEINKDGMGNICYLHAGARTLIEHLNEGDNAKELLERYQKQFGEEDEVEWEDR